MVVSQISVALIEPVDLYRDLMVTCIDDQPSLKVEFAVRALAECDTATCSRVDVVVASLYLAHSLVVPSAILSELQSYFPDTRIIVISDCRARRAITAFLRCGARGYLIRNSMRSVELLQAVHVVAEGSLILSSESREIVLAPEPEVITFRPRELDIIRILPEFKHRPRVEIARELRMSLANLNNRISNIAIKLNATGIQGIVDRCFELGVIVDDQSFAPAVNEELESSERAASEEIRPIEVNAATEGDGISPPLMTSELRHADSSLDVS